MFYNNINILPTLLSRHLYQRRWNLRTNQKTSDALGSSVWCVRTPLLDLCGLLTVDLIAWRVCPSQLERRTANVDPGASLRSYIRIQVHFRLYQLPMNYARLLPPPGHQTRRMGEWGVHTSINFPSHPRDRNIQVFQKSEYTWCENAYEYVSIFKILHLI